MMKYRCRYIEAAAPGNRQENDDEKVRILVSGGEEQVRRDRAEASANQGDAEKIRGDENPGADQPADDRRHEHGARVAHPEDRTRGERAEYEAEDRQDDAEQAIAEEAGDDSADEQTIAAGSW